MTRPCFAMALLATAFIASAQAADSRPNLLIITVDDMNADSMGAFGCTVPETSPTMDELARRSLRFQHAHVQVGNCMPGRNVMWSGLYPHNNGVEGFFQVPDAKHPHLCDLMKQAGYFTAIRGKATHSTPYHPYAWDADVTQKTDGTKHHVKDAKSYGTSTATAIAAAKEADKPFCLMVNISDPHKPFYAANKKGETVPDKHVPSKVFTADDVTVPGFLFDDPIVRKELGHYYSSVRRADDCLAETLAALKKSGQEDSTVIIFLSDHGMPLPFAKTQLYHHSTGTPLLVCWPGVTQAGAIDQQHMVSAVDFVPTIMDIIDAPHPEKQDGFSFAPLIRGASQTDREYVFKEYCQNSGASCDPMRAVQSKQHLYIFNPWSNGERVFATATTGTQTCKRMKELAASDPKLAARYEIYQHRVPEEFFDVAADPDCLHNLIDSAEHQATIQTYRDQLTAWMERTSDPMTEMYRNREEAAAREAYVVSKEKVADARRAAKRKKGRGNNKGNRKNKEAA